MGNWITKDNDSKELENESIDQEIDLDSMTKHELIKYIQKLNIKKLDIFDASYENLIKNLEINSDGLLPIEIEIFEKLQEKLPVYDPKNYAADKNKKYKFKSFIKPKFGQDKVKFDSPIDDKNKIDTPSNKLLDYEVAQPKTKISTESISLEEYNNAFLDNKSKLDMIGFPKKFMTDCSNLVKYKMINFFNNAVKNNNIDNINTTNFGRASYVYKKAKKGPTDEVSSFRQVIMIPNIINHFHRVLALRLTKYVTENEYLDTTIQKGGVSGIASPLFQQILKIKTLLKSVHKNKQEAVLMFVDINDAFPSLTIDKVSHVLQKYGVDKTFINYIQNFYSNFEYYIETKEWKTELVKWNRGLLQGCPMSPLLFVLVLNYLLKHLENKYSKTHGLTFKNSQILFTAYMDDIVITCKDAYSMDQVFTDLEKVLAEFGLKVSKDKTKYMHINPTKEYVTTVAKVDKFKYLGEYIFATGTSDASYFAVLYGLKSKLTWLDNNSKMTLEQKQSYITRLVLPALQRKFMVLYDVSKEDKTKILKILNVYIDKWKIDLANTTIELMPDFKELLATTTDKMLKNIDIEEYLHSIIGDKQDIKTTKTTITVKDIKFDYDNNKKEDLDKDEIEDTTDSPDEASEDVLSDSDDE